VAVPMQIEVRAPPRGSGLPHCHKSHSPSDSKTNDYQRSRDGKRGADEISSGRCLVLYDPRHRSDAAM
jgi:hypothetical protein